MHTDQDLSWKKLVLDLFHSVSMAFIPNDSEMEKE